MSDDDLDIPDFLRRAPGERQAAWKPLSPSGRKRPEKVGNWHLPKHMDATCWALLREREGVQQAKKQASLAALKQWKLEHKR